MAVEGIRSTNKGDEAWVKKIEAIIDQQRRDIKTLQDKVKTLSSRRS